MFSTTLLPDFRKLSNYFPELTKGEINQIEASKGIEIHLEYFDEVSYNSLSDKLKIVLQTYDLSDHFNEILYLIIRREEANQSILDQQWLTYYNAKASSELAGFLLAFKESKPNHPLQLDLKTLTQSSHIKNNRLATWLCEIIYKAVESKDFTMDELGIQILHDLFGGNPFSNDPITLHNLRETAKAKVAKPSEKRLMAEFCIYLQHYLINETPLKLTDGKRLTDKQANFLFDVLAVLDYVNEDEVSIPKDYIYSLIKNHKLQLSV